MPMILKMNANGDGAVVSDGKPVYLDGDREILFDAPATVVKIRELSDQRDASRTKIAAIEAKFAGIEDPEAARAALQAVANIKDGKLIEAGKIDEVVKERSAAAEKAWAAKEQAFTKTIGDKDAAIFDLRVGSKFETSKTLKEKTFLPGRVAKATFGEHFKIEDDGNVVAYDKHGRKIFSSEKPGEPADFEEAISILIASDPDKDMYLRGANNGGGGSTTTRTADGTAAHVLSRERAQDPSAYRAAKEAAEKAGVPLQIQG